MNELYSGLWAYRTKKQTLTKKIPFNFAFGTKAAIPLETGLSSICMERFNEEDNSGNFSMNLDLLEGTQEHASL